MQALILFSCLVAAASAWNCPNLPVVEQLNVTRMAGTWYQQGAAGAAFLTQPCGKCVTAVYTEDTNGTSLFTLKNSQKLWGTTIEVTGWANWLNTEENGKLNVTISNLLFETSSELWVLDSDYDNFLVLYSCKKTFGIPAQSSWILRREQNPTGDDKTALDTLIAASFEKIQTSGGPDLKDFEETDQSKC